MAFKSYPKMARLGLCGKGGYFVSITIRPSQLGRGRREQKFAGGFQVDFHAIIVGIELLRQAVKSASASAKRRARK